MDNICTQPKKAAIDMTAREYLEQAYRIDHRINSKLEQVANLRALATKATSTLSSAPKRPNRSSHRMEDIIAKMIDMETDINHEIDQLVDLKCETAKIIQKVGHPEYKMLLELRYLCFHSWTKIADLICFSLRHMNRMHQAALEKIDELRKLA